MPGVPPPPAVHAAPAPQVQSLPSPERTVRGSCITQATGFPGATPAAAASSRRGQRQNLGCAATVPSRRGGARAWPRPAHMPHPPPPGWKEGGGETKRHRPFRLNRVATIRYGWRGGKKMQRAGHTPMESTYLAFLGVRVTLVSVNPKLVFSFLSKNV